MVPSTPTAEKPDWGLRIGLGLWVVIAAFAAWVIFDAFGWHIPRYAVSSIIGYVVYRFIDYRFEVTTRAVLEVVREIEKTNNRLEELETSIANRLNRMNRRLSENEEPDYLKRLREEGMLD